MVEDGVSKKDRAEFLKRQREERKLNRKKGIQFSMSKTAPPGSANFRNGQTSAPAMMTPAAVDAPAAQRTPLTLIGEADFCPASPKPAIEDRGAPGSKRIPPPSMALAAGVSPTGPAATGKDQQGGGPSRRKDSTPTGEAVPPLRAPPPRMFNPTGCSPSYRTSERSHRLPRPACHAPIHGV